MRWGRELASGQWRLHSLPDVGQDNSGLGHSLGVVGRIVDPDHTALQGHHSRLEGLAMRRNR